MYYVIGYRRKVVRQNLNNTFPEKSEKEIKQIERTFFRHLTDTFIESIKIFSISRTQVEKRMIFNNTELPDKYFEKGQNIIIVGSHYGNWELFAVGSGLYHKHLLIGIYTPLTNKFFDKKVNQSREKFGLDMRSKKDYKNIFQAQEAKPYAIIFALDQSPSKDSGIWTTFLNQETGVAYGAEKLAQEKNYPVIYGDLRRVKRGHFALTYKLIDEAPTGKKKGELTVKATRMLEGVIKEFPEYWLWSHRRWKHKRPENAELYE